MKKNVELLAPAGGTDQFFAAVENGADAVYLGGFKFNARIKADNFTTSQLANAIRYAHLRNVKIYVTVNILLSDEELPKATEYCTQLYNMKADGIIVQDLGLANWVKKNLPDLELHLSTQGTVYNLSGVKAAESLGFSRVVLARETTLCEIKKITDSSQMDIEMFVHGALCMCYSGQCQMSRVIGGINGRSGNRGLCAQPCRLPYSVSGGKDEYPLSPKDLCALDSLIEILDSGVTSLKIEGRMKSAEYVAVVTGIYRKYLDEYMKNRTYKVEQKDRDALRQIYSRGTFTTGYLLGNPEEKLLTKGLPKHQGIYIGKVTNVLHSKNLIDIELTQPLAKGDGIEIRNKNLTGNMVTYLEKIGSRTHRIGDIKGTVKVGQPVYRISRASLLKEAKKSYEGADFIDGKCHKRVNINLELDINIGSHPTLKIVEKENTFVFTDQDIQAEKALNRPLEKSMAQRQLRKTGNTCFAVKNVIVNLEEGSTLPLSALNKLRRDALDAYSLYKLDSKPEEVDPQYIFPERKEEKRRLAFYFYDGKKIKNYDFYSKMDLLKVEKAKLYMPLQDFMNKPEIPDNLEPIPYILNISKGNLDEYIENNFDLIVENVRSNGIAIGNLGWCREFASRGITVHADYGLNLNNESAKDTVRLLGVSPTYMSLEYQDEGQWPIMITEHPLPYKQLIDRKNQYYHILKATSGDKWMLFKTTKPLSNNSLLEQWKNSNGEFRIYVSD